MLQGFYQDAQGAHDVPMHEWNFFQQGTGVMEVPQDFSFVPAPVNDVPAFVYDNQKFINDNSHTLTCGENA